MLQTVTGISCIPGLAIKSEEKPSYAAALHQQDLNMKDRVKSIKN